MDAVGTGVKGKRAYKRRIFRDTGLWCHLKDSNGICTDCGEAFTPKFRAQYTCDPCREVAWVRYNGVLLIGLDIILQRASRQL